MPLPGPKVGDYLAPIRNAYKREKATMYRHFRILTGVPHPVVQEAAPVARTAKSKGK